LGSFGFLCSWLIALARAGWTALVRHHGQRLGVRREHPPPRLAAAACYMPTHFCAVPMHSCVIMRHHLEVPGRLRVARIAGFGRRLSPSDWSL
jgi:hypothetical protein